MTMTLLNPANSLRLLRAVAFSAMLTLVAAVGVAVASPAQAATGETYQNISSWGCIIGPGLESDPNRVATTDTCGGNNSYVMNWSVISRGTSPSGHRLVQLESTFNGKCLDTNSTDTGAIWEKGCVTGLNQVWEVFHQTQSSGADTITFKSWGAWTYHARHRCMKATATSGQIVLAVCDTGAASQNWG
jgi:hypothetical protein